MAGGALTVGSLTFDPDTAQRIVRTYTQPVATNRPTRRDYYAWPFYDGLDAHSTPDELSDGDLLAPVLLNVNVGIHGFATLQALRGDLVERLAHVPRDVDLADASDGQIRTVVHVFAVLDGTRTLGVGGTTLSKVLHRKRPRLIPLHDRHVRAAYVPGRVTSARHHSWAEYLSLLMKEMRDDLAASESISMSLEAIPAESDVVLTRLRALDVLAWHRGKSAANA